MNRMRKVEINNGWVQQDGTTAHTGNLNGFPERWVLVNESFPRDCGLQYRLI